MNSRRLTVTWLVVVLPSTIGNRDQQIIVAERAESDCRVLRGIGAICRKADRSRGRADNGPAVGQVGLTSVIAAEHA